MCIKHNSEKKQQQTNSKGKNKQKISHKVYEYLF